MGKILVTAALILFASQATAANDDDNAPESPAYQKCVDRLSKGKEASSAVFRKCDQIVYGAK